MRGLLWTKSLPKRSQILGETLARASTEDAAHLACGALLLDAPFSQVAPHLERILADAPERDAFEIVERLHGVLSEKKRGARAHLRRVHDALAPGPVRDALARALRIPSEAETYWK